MLTNKDEIIKLGNLIYNNLFSYFHMYDKIFNIFNFSKKLKVNTATELSGIFNRTNPNTTFFNLLNYIMNY